MEVRLKEKIPGVFWPVHQAIRRSEVTEVVAKGGRGSGKSSYLSMELVWQLLRHPDCHAVVLRKVGGTLRNSVYNQIVWAIGELGCAGYFRCTVSPMECTYLPTGQKIDLPDIRLPDNLPPAERKDSFRNPEFGNIPCCGRYSRRIFPHAVHRTERFQIPGCGKRMPYAFPGSEWKIPGVPARSIRFRGDTCR